MEISNIAKNKFDGGVLSVGGAGKLEQVITATQNITRLT